MGQCQCGKLKRSCRRDRVGRIGVSTPTNTGLRNTIGSSPTGRRSSHRPPAAVSSVSGDRPPAPHWSTTVTLRLFRRSSRRMHASETTTEDRRRRRDMHRPCSFLEASPRLLVHSPSVAPPVRRHTRGHSKLAAHRARRRTPSPPSFLHGPRGGRSCRRDRQEEAAPDGPRAGFGSLRAGLRFIFVGRSRASHGNHAALTALEARNPTSDCHRRNQARHAPSVVCHPPR